MKLQQHPGSKPLSLCAKMFPFRWVGSNRMLSEKPADVVLEASTLGFTDFTRKWHRRSRLFPTKGSELTAFCQRRLSLLSESSKNPACQLQPTCFARTRTKKQKTFLWYKERERCVQRRWLAVSKHWKREDCFFNTHIWRSFEWTSQCLLILDTNIGAFKVNPPPPFSMKKTHQLTYGK